MKPNNTTQQPKTFSPEADKALNKLAKLMRKSNYKTRNITNDMTRAEMRVVAREVFGIEIQNNRSRDPIIKDFEKIFQNNPDILSNALQHYTVVQKASKPKKLSGGGTGVKGRDGSTRNGYARDVSIHHGYNPTEDEINERNNELGISENKCLYCGKDLSLIGIDVMTI